MRSEGNRLVLLCVGVVVACGEPEPPPVAPPVAPPAPLSLDDAWTHPLAEVRVRATELGTGSLRAAGTAEGVLAARDAARFARVLGVRDPAEDWDARARAWLIAASADASVDGACEASLELARLEARASRLAEAYRVAFRTEVRFPTHDACRDAATALTERLAPYRPSEAELAAIRAHPDDRDPPADAPLAGSLDELIAAWTRERAEEGERATLEAMTIYGRSSLSEAGPESPGRAASVRTVLRFDRVVSYEHGEAPAARGDARRTWLQLPSTSMAAGIEATTLVGQGGLARIVTTEADGAVRVTFELEEGARARAFVLPEPYRVVMDVEPGGPRSEHPVRLVVLDPGHGGDDFGARAFHLRESDLTLDLARRVRVLLARRLPEVQVVLTRDEDELVSLEARSALANALDADLFLSIHLNAADDEVEHGGVTTFVLDTSDDRQVLRLAARENGTSTAEVGSLARLLAAMHRTDQVRESRALADQVHRSTLSAGRTVLPTLHDRGVKSAMFYVLVGARMPAVLLEASFLSREEEANALSTVAYRQTLAEGIADGIVRWIGE